MVVQYRHKIKMMLNERSTEMRTYDEVLNAICEQVVHGIKKCGWNDSTAEDFSECIDMAIDMVMTSEEIDAYADRLISYDVKTSIAL